jgi:alcohol dehydrogenase
MPATGGAPLDNDHLVIAKIGHEEEVRMGQTTSALVLPRWVRHGPGALAAIGALVEERRVRRAFVLTDRGVAAVGLLERLEAAIAAAGVSWETFTEVEAEPTVAAVERAADALRASGGVDLVVSLGGGSVIDTAKCAIAAVANRGRVTDFEDGADGARAIETTFPHLAIPTTAGTGSEATIWGVYVDAERSFKAALGSPLLVPEAVILDPELTLGLPAAVTAASGIDAFTHAVEACASVYATPFSDALALEAVAMIGGALRAAVSDGSDLAARSAMLLASFMAGIAFSNSSCGLAHTLAEVIGGLRTMPHGVACETVLPAVVEFNAPRAGEKYARVARALGVGTEDASGEAAAHAVAGAAARLASDVGLPSGLAAAGVTQAQLPGLASLASAWANESGNPREADEPELLGLLEQSL